MKQHKMVILFQAKERGKEPGYNPLRTFPVLIPKDLSLHLIEYLFLQSQLNFFPFSGNIATTIIEE